MPYEEFINNKENFVEKIYEFLGSKNYNISKIELNKKINANPGDLGIEFIRILNSYNLSYQTVSYIKALLGKIESNKKSKIFISRDIFQEWENSNKETERLTGLNLKGLNYY